MIKKNYIEKLILGAYIICLPCFTHNTMTDGLVNHCILIFAALSTLLLLATSPIRKMSITRLDVFMLIFLIWILLNSFVINNRVLSDEKLALILTSFFVFVVSKFTLSWTEKTLSVMLALGGIWQSLIAWFQYGGILNSNHSEFPVTGNFSNPAHLGAYIGLAIISAFYLIYYYHRQKRHMLCICLFWGLLFMIGIFLLAFSRASWVSLIVVLVLLLWKYNILKHKVLLFSALLFFISLSPLLYRMKQASSDGRLFIWNVSIELIKSAPLQGRGGDAFAANYMLAQADFLKSHADSGYEMTATDNIHAFNEFLQITCEYGIIGLFFLIAILYSAFKSPGNSIAKFILVYICVFACFSYFFEVPALFILCSILIGLLSNKIAVHGKYLHANRRFVACLCILVTLSITFYLPTKTYNRTYVLQHAYQLYHSKKYADALSYLQQAYTLCPVSNICMDLGNCHYYLGNYKEAEFYLTKARWMVPSHILPRYYLFRVYVTQGNTKNIQVFGNEILNDKFKKEGSVAMEVRHYVSKYLDEYAKCSSNSDN